MRKNRDKSESIENKWILQNVVVFLFFATLDIPLKTLHKQRKYKPVSLKISNKKFLSEDLKYSIRTNQIAYTYFKIKYKSFHSDETSDKTFLQSPIGVVPLYCKFFYCQAVTCKCYCVQLILLVSDLLDQIIILLKKTVYHWKLTWSFSNDNSKCYLCSTQRYSHNQW